MLLPREPRWPCFRAFPRRSSVQTLSPSYAPRTTIRHRCRLADAVRCRGAKARQRHPLRQRPRTKQRRAKDQWHPRIRPLRLRHGNRKLHRKSKVLHKPPLRHRRRRAGRLSPRTWRLHLWGSPPPLIVRRRKRTGRASRNRPISVHREYLAVSNPSLCRSV